MCSNSQRPYHVEHTSSRLITEVKQHWARIVLGWETAWDLLVLLAFYKKKEKKEKKNLCSNIFCGARYIATPFSLVRRVPYLCSEEKGMKKRKMVSALGVK